MVYQKIVARNFLFNRNDGRPAAGNGGGLDVLMRRALQAPLLPNTVEDFPIDVEATEEIGTAVSDEDAHGVADLRSPPSGMVIDCVGTPPA